jgi:penicillin-binding protein 1C
MSAEHSPNRSSEEEPQSADPAEDSLGDTQPSKPTKLKNKYGSGKAEAESPEPKSKIDPEEGFTPAPPPLGETPVTESPILDESGMPLPQRVPERDVDATQVVGSAFFQAPTKESPSSKVGGVESRSAVLMKRFYGMGCLVRGLIFSAFAGLILAILGTSFALYEYSAIASTLPNVDGLRERASQFETTRILDSDGRLLYEILDPNAGRRTYVPLDEISPHMLAATISIEDKDFYEHPGFSAIAIFRAFYQNFTNGEVVSGASTVTQQLARILLLSPEEAGDRTYLRKVREAILATEITRRYSKDEILELYLNEIYFGNLSYGVQAAAETYFGVAAKDLNLAQASFIAGLPQAPSVYDVYSNPAATLVRQQQVLNAMNNLSQEEGCIYVSTQSERVCVDLEMAAEAAVHLLDFEFEEPDFSIRYPHWVHYIRTLLEQQFDPQTIYRSGFTVYTSIDSDLQNIAEQMIADGLIDLSDRDAHNGALVAIRPSDGAILAMVGSADFYNDDIDGQVNMAVSPRQPGSSIKPLTYTLAFENGWTPSTLIWDVESEFPPSGNIDDPRDPYIPENYDDSFHGPVTLRSALANSYNIPAVKALDFVGIYDDPETEVEEGLVGFAHRMGISDLNEADYGLSLTLGGGEVKLLDLTNAYAIFASGGQKVSPVAITRIEDSSGELVFEAPDPTNEQVIRPEHAFLISSILSDHQARIPSFGRNSILNLPFSAAAKTGTTNDFRDSWTVGFTPDLAVGIWVGNADFTPMDEVSGLRGAAPIWVAYMQAAVEQLSGVNPPSFAPPEGITEHIICEVSGASPSEWCPEEKRDFFAADQPPLPPEEDLWQELDISTWNEKIANELCADGTEEEFAMNVSDPWAIEWLTESNDGRAWAEENGFEDPIFFTPQDECEDSDSIATLKIISPSDADTLRNESVQIRIQADASQHFDEYVLEFAYGDKPDPWDWEELQSSDDPIAEAENVYTWQLKDLRRGTLSLRLIMYSTQNTFAEEIILLNIQVPTPTPLPTNTPTNTLVPSNTPSSSPTWTPTESLTASPSATASETLAALATFTPTELATSTETSLPSPSATLTASPTPTITPSPTP